MNDRFVLDSDDIVVKDKKKNSLDLRDIILEEDMFIENDFPGHKGRKGIGRGGSLPRTGGGGQSTKSESQTILEKFNALRDKMNYTDEEKRQLRYKYFGNMENCQRVQEYMKTGEDSYLDSMDGGISETKASDCAELMKRKIRETTLDEDVTLYRGMYISKKSLDKLEKNGFTSKIFQSTSLDTKESRELVEHYRDKQGNNQSKTGVMLEIHAKKGQHYMTSPLEGELEIVLPPEGKFKIKNKTVYENKPTEGHGKARPLVLYEVEYEE